MKLYMHKVSTTSRPVILFAAEEGIDMEMSVVDLMTGEHHGEAYSKINPNHLVPTLDDDGFILTESSTILKYLADKTGSAAYPKGLQERARVNEVMDWFNTQFYREFGYHMVYPQVYPHHLREPEAAQATTLQWGKDQASICLTVLNDNILGGNKYLCGDSITIADYFGAGLASCGELIGVQFGGYPNVQKWFDTMKALPNWGSVSDVHDGFAASLKEKTFVAIT